MAPPKIAICTCAYNEARVIEKKILNLLDLKQKYPNLETLLYVDGATDGTAQIVEKYADRIKATISTERRGKTFGMNHLISLSSAELIVFSDANVQLDPDALSNLLVHFQDTRVGCVCGNLIYTNPNASTTASTGSAYWRLEQFIKRLESKVGSVMGADGSIFAIRRELHHPPPDDIIDDMYVSFQILCNGYRVIQVEDVRAYEESVTASKEEFRRKVRIACQAFNVHRLLWPRIRASFTPLRLYFYFSHKLLRWLSIYFLVLGYALFAAAIAASGYPWVAMILTLLIAALIFIGHSMTVPVVSKLVDILSAIVGAGLGVWRSLKGDRFQTWQPAASIRK